MENLFLLHPEVAGALGDNTVVANRIQLESGSAIVREITHLEYVFDGWLGDELLESYPCFIVTESLAADLTNANLLGLKLGSVEISISETFEELYPGRNLPAFRRLMPQGEVQITKKGKIRNWSQHDLCLTERAELVVSKRCLDVLQRHQIEQCEVQELVHG